jgi:hypothetical protein
MPVENVVRKFLICRTYCLVLKADEISGRQLRNVTYVTLTKPLRMVSQVKESKTWPKLLEP